MLERRRLFGVTFLHIAAPAVIWIYVSACRSVAGEVDEANVAVVEFRAAGGVCGGRSSDLFFQLGLCHSNILCRIVIKHKEHAVFERQQIEAPVETLARGV